MPESVTPAPQSPAIQPPSRLKAALARWWRQPAVPLGVVVVVGYLLTFALQSFMAERAASAIVRDAKRGDILMISSATCVFCEQARAWMTERKVPFTECFIETDAQCAATYRALFAPGTPTLLVRGQRQVGFSPQSVADALAR